MMPITLINSSFPMKSLPLLLVLIVLIVALLWQLLPWISLLAPRAAELVWLTLHHYGWILWRQVTGL